MKFRARLIALYRQLQKKQGDKFEGKAAVPVSLRSAKNRLQYFAPQAELETRAAADGQGETMRVVINTRVVDRYDTIVEPAGGKFENFIKNPVLLWSHGHDPAVGMVPIGSVPLVVPGEEQVEANVRFFEEEPGAKFGAMYKAKKLRGFSIGFLPITYQVEMLESREVLRFIEWELVELSAVAVPANPEALARDIEAGDFKFETKIVNDVFSGVCECVAKAGNPEELLCRVLDVEVPEYDWQNNAPPPEPESLALRSVNDADPLGLGHLAEFAVQNGGTAGAAAMALASSSPPPLEAAVVGAPLERAASGGAACGCGGTGTASAAGAPAAGAAAPPVEERSLEERLNDELGRLVGTLNIETASPELRAALAKIAPGLAAPAAAAASAAPKPDFAGAWCTADECRMANPQALPLMAAASVEVAGQRVFFFVHHRGANGAISVPALLASMRDLIGESHNISREELGAAYDHLAAHYKELGIAPPEPKPHTPAQCYDLALRGVVTHAVGARHFIFDKAEERELDGKKHLLPVFRDIQTGELMAFQPPNTGRLTDSRMWGRRDLGQPEGAEALLERLVQAEERVAVMLEERAGAKFSKATKDRIGATIQALADLSESLRSVAGNIGSTAEQLRSMITDGDAEGDRGVSGQAREGEGGSGQGGGSTAPVLGEEFVRKLSETASAALDSARVDALAERRARVAAGTSGM